MTRKQKSKASELLFVLTYALENGKTRIDKDISSSWIYSAKKLASEIDKELKKNKGSKQNETR
jgi:hypothetical protein